MVEPEPSSHLTGLKDEVMLVNSGISVTVSSWQGSWKDSGKDDSVL